MRRFLRHPAVPVPRPRVPHPVYYQQVPPPQHHAAPIPQPAPMADYAGYPEEYYQDAAGYYYTEAPAYDPVIGTPVSQPGFQTYPQGPRFPGPLQRPPNDRYQQAAGTQYDENEDSSVSETSDAGGDADEESVQDSEFFEPSDSAPMAKTKKEPVVRQQVQKSSDQQRVSITITGNSVQAEARPRGKKVSKEKKSDPDSSAEKKAGSDPKAPTKSETASAPVVSPAPGKLPHPETPPAAKSVAAVPPKPEAKKPTPPLPSFISKAMPNMKSFITSAALPNMKSIIPSAVLPNTKPNIPSAAPPNTKPNIPSAVPPNTKPNIPSAVPPNTKPNIPSAVPPITKPNTPGALTQKNNSSEDEPPVDTTQAAGGQGKRDSQPRISIPYSQMYDSSATLALYGQRSTADIQPEPNSLDKLKWIICCCCKRLEQNPEHLRPDASKESLSEKVEIKQSPSAVSIEPSSTDEKHEEDEQRGRGTIIRLEIGDSSSEVDGPGVDDETSSVSSCESGQCSEEDDSPSGGDDDD